MSDPKGHHYLARLYLRPFAHQNRVTLRRRGAKPVTAAVEKVAKVTHLYSTKLPDGTHDATAEKTIGGFEGKAATILRTLREGGPIPERGTDERHALALFCGLQLVRTPESAERWLFPASVIAYAGGRPTHEQMRAYLRDEHLGFDPTDAEVEGALLFVNAAPRDGGPPNKAQLLHFMFENAIHTLSPTLEALQWSVEDCTEARFVTCDRLPAMWSTPVDADRYRGVGIETAEELWLPLDPSTMLVMRPEGAERRTKADGDRARMVNRHLARHCYTSVVHDPRFVPDRDELVMGPLPLRSRFNVGPVVVDGQRTGHEAFHFWTPIRDDAWHASSTLT